MQPIEDRADSSTSTGTERVGELQTLLTEVDDAFTHLASALAALRDLRQALVRLYQPDDRPAPDGACNPSDTDGGDQL